MPATPEPSDQQSPQGLPAIPEPVEPSRLMLSRSDGILPGADWSDFVPAAERPQRRRRRRRAHLYAMVRDRLALIRLCLGFYLLICLLLLFSGQLLLTAYALLPVLLTPPLGYMMYWLVWKEFHE